MKLTTEVERAAPISVREEFGATRLGTDADSVAEVLQKDEPEAVSTFPLPVRQEIHAKTSSAHPNPPPHISTEVHG